MIASGPLALQTTSFWLAAKSIRDNGVPDEEGNAGFQLWALREKSKFPRIREAARLTLQAADSV